MPLLQKLKSLLGRDDRSEPGQDVTVTVEHDPENEAAVKGLDADAADEPPVSSDDVSGGESVTESTADESAKTGAADAAADADEAETAEPAGSDESPDVLNGIGPAYAGRLADAGVDTVAELAAADAGELAASTEIAEGRLQGWIDQAKDH